VVSVGSSRELGFGYSNLLLAHPCAGGVVVVVVLHASNLYRVVDVGNPSPDAEGFHSGDISC